MSQNDIFQFEVAMHDLLGVKMLHPFHYLSDDNGGAFFRECSFHLK